MTKGLEIFFGISLLLFALIYVTKAIIHAILDSRNGYPVQYGSVWGYINFLPYDNAVSEGDEKLKRACNYLQKTSILFLIILIIASLFKLVNRQ
jgi:hypothetical protein